MCTTSSGPCCAPTLRRALRITHQRAIWQAFEAEKMLAGVRRNQRQHAERQHAERQHPSAGSRSAGTAALPSADERRLECARRSWNV